jgi:hypothetical protein
MMATVSGGLEKWGVLCFGAFLVGGAEDKPQFNSEWK